MLLNKSKKYGKFGNGVITSTFSSLINPDTLGRNLSTMGDLARHMKKPIRTGNTAKVDGIDLVERVSGQWKTDPRFPGARIRSTSYRGD